MQFDPSTGQYYDEARWYADHTGRFLRPDPLGFEAGDVDLYRYADNNVTTLTDPNGEIVPLLLFAAAMCRFLL